MVYLKKVDIFKAEGEFVVTKAFKAEGRLFQVGDPFPWKNINLTPRRLKQLYYANFVEYKTEFDRVEKKRSGKKSPAEPTNSKKAVEVKAPIAPAAEKISKPKPAGGKKKSTNSKKAVK